MGWIYTITNRTNNKIYVGYAVNIEQRLYDHKIQLIGNRHHNRKLQNSVKKYGIDSFLFEKLEEYPNNLLPAMEHYWATVLNTHNNNYGYNIKPTDPNGKPGVSLETIKLIKEALTGRKMSEEFREGCRQRNLGKKLTEEHKKKIGIASKGNKHSLGKKQSQETIRKRIESKRKAAEERGYWFSEETNKKRGDAQRGKKLSPEHIEFLRQINTGRKISKETSLKKSAANLFRYRKEFDCFDIKGIFIKTFFNIKEAADYFGWNRNSWTNIRNALKGNYKQTRGYIFKYKEVKNG